MSRTIQYELIGLCCEEIVFDNISEVKAGKSQEFFLFWQVKSEIVPILNKCHLLCNMLINSVKLEKNLFNF